MSAYDHPLPKGTILRAPNYDHAYKVIVDVTEKPQHWKYTAFQIGKGPDCPVSQTSLDFDEMANSDAYTDYVVMFKPDTE